MSDTDTLSLVVRPVPSPLSSPQTRLFREWLGSLSPNTRRSYQTALWQFWEWHGGPEHYPIEENTVLEWLRFLRDDERVSYSTLRARLSAFSSIHQVLGYEPVSSYTRVRLFMRTTQRAAPPKNKAEAISANALRQWAATLDDSLTACRDRALVLFGFSSGGRRRSEIANLRYEDLERVSRGFLATIRNHKTSRDADDVLVVPVFGRAAEALEEWLRRSEIEWGHVFRALTLDGYVVTERGLCTRQVARIIQKTGAESAHSLRAGFLTECDRNNIPLSEAMAMSGHKSPNVARSYYRQGDVMRNRASELI